MNTAVYDNSRYSVEILSGNTWVQVSSPKCFGDAMEIHAEYAQRGHRARLLQAR